MIKFSVSIVMAILISGICFADDPGERDTIIVETVFAQLGDSTAEARIWAVTDDSVVFYNFPLAWESPLGGIRPVEVSYHNTLLFWEETFHIILYDQNFIRMLGWRHLGGSDPYLYLFTNGDRLHLWSVLFEIDSTALPQVVVIDTTSDPLNDSLVFCLPGGVILFIPEFISGSIYYGINSEIEQMENQLPNSVLISQNYPNPFNAKTTIKYSLSEQSDVTIEIYDIIGRKVDTIYKGYQPAGQHQVIWDASDHSSGVYFYRLEIGDFSKTKKMILLK